VRVNDEQEQKEKKKKERDGFYNMSEKRIKSKKARRSRKKGNSSKK